MKCFQTRKTPAPSPLHAPARFLGENLIQAPDIEQAHGRCLKSVAVSHECLWS